MIECNGWPLWRNLRCSVIACLSKTRMGPTGPVVDGVFVHEILGGEVVEDILSR